MTRICTGAMGSNRPMKWGGAGAEAQYLVARGNILPLRRAATPFHLSRLLRLFRLSAGTADFPTACRSTSGVIAIVPYYPTMAQLLVRDLPEALVLALEERAAANGRSAEAEHRLTLEEALRSGATSSASAPDACVPRPPAGFRGNLPISFARIATPDNRRRRRLDRAEMGTGGWRSDAGDGAAGEGRGGASLGLLDACNALWHRTIRGKRTRAEAIDC